jgi:hypothetical protein
MDRERLTQHELDRDVRSISPYCKIAVKSASERAGRWGRNVIPDDAILARFVAFASTTFGSTIRVVG